MEFNNDDKAYLQWLDNNPKGFVINMQRSKSTSYMILHRATCNTIANRLRYPEGAYTEREYIKICATQITDLRNWARQHGRIDGLAGSECSRCNPE